MLVRDSRDKSEKLDRSDNSYSTNRNTVTLVMTMIVLTVCIEGHFKTIDLWNVMKQSSSPESTD